MAVSSRRQFSAEKGICHMSDDTITKLPDPSGFGSDPFTAVLRDGARKADRTGDSRGTGRADDGVCRGERSKMAARGWCVMATCLSVK